MMTTAVAKREAAKTPTQFDLDHGGLQITNSDQMWDMAKFFANSDMVGQCYKNKPQNIVVAWQMGAELGLSPKRSLDGIAVINGRAALWGETLTGVVQASGLMLLHKTWHSGSIKQGNLTAHVQVHRKGEADPVEYTFTQEQAEIAGLWGRNTWKSYPHDMLMWKAKARAYRGSFADVISGVPMQQDMDPGFTRRTVRNEAQVSEIETPTTATVDPLMADDDDITDAHIIEPDDDHTDPAPLQQEPDPEPEQTPAPTIDTLAASLIERTECIPSKATTVLRNRVKKLKGDPDNLTTDMADMIATLIDDGTFDEAVK